MAKENKIRVALFEPGKEPVETHIENDLKALQKCVHGYIECIQLSDDLVMVCNDEGKLNGSLPNRRLGDDTIFDTFVVVGDTHDDDGNFRSLTDDEMALVYMAFYNYIDTSKMSTDDIEKLRDIEIKITAF